MDETDVYLDGTQTVRNLLVKAFDGKFTFFIGKPDMIAQAAFPVVVVRKAHTTSRVGATMTDDVEEDILIHVLMNAKVGWGTPDDDDTVERQLTTIIEGRDPATGFYLATSFMHVLRQNITFTSTIINNDVEINYDSTDIKDQSTMYEALITVTTTSRVFLPNRY